MHERLKGTEMAHATLLPSRGVGSRGVARSLDLFLSRSSDDLSGVRPIVARSWYRSRAAGVDSQSDRTVVEAGRVDEPTLLAAELHLRMLDELAADMGGYVSLSAPSGALMKPNFLRDDDGFPAGYSLREECSGSNGEGIALEEGRGVWLAPEEHFREDMRRNWCFASLIRDPFHHRVRGVVGLTFPAERVIGIEPSSTLLMLEGVVSRIEREIENRTSSRERQLLNEYLTVSRRHGSAPTLAVDGKNIFMNTCASASLEDTDFAVICGYAKEVLASGNRIDQEVVLKGVGAVTLDVSPVNSSALSVGAVIVVHSRADEGRSRDEECRAPQHDSAAPFGSDDGAIRTHLDGASAEFQRTVGLAQAAVSSKRSVAIIGEAGSGRRRLADAIASHHADVVEFDAALRAADGVRIRNVVREAVDRSAAAIIIEHADELTTLDAIEAANLLRVAPGTQVLLTLRRPTDATQLLAEACNALEIPIAPLRNRREDIPVLANAIALEIGPKTLSRNLVATLTNSDWSRNIHQLRAILVEAIEGAQGSVVTVDDLPRAFHKVETNGRLSRLEDAELSEMRMALREAKGNRRLAAEMLEIGRSTLYRRMDYFRGRGFEL